MINTEKEFKEYKTNFIAKWRPKFANSQNKLKTYRSNYYEFTKDFEPLFEYVLYSYFSERNKNLVNIKEVIDIE